METREAESSSIFMCKCCNLFSPNQAELLSHVSEKHREEGVDAEDIIIPLRPLTAEPADPPQGGPPEPSAAKRKRGRPRGSTKKPHASEGSVENSGCSPSEENAPGAAEEEDEEEEEEEEGSPSGPPPGPLECRKCGRRFSNGRQLRKHICIIVLNLGEEEGEPGNDSDVELDRKDKEAERQRAARRPRVQRAERVQRGVLAKDAGPGPGPKNPIVSVVLTAHEAIPGATKIVPVEAGAAEAEGADSETAPPEPARRKGYQEYAIQQTPYEQPTKSSRLGPTQLKIFTCEYCNKVFKFKHSLQAHLRTHTKEKPHRCPHCSYASAIKANLNVHLRKHTGERFGCDACSFTCLSKGHLKVHVERVHQKIKQHCRFCKKKYSDVKNLIKHVREAHDPEEPRVAGALDELRLLTREGKRQLLYDCHVCERKFKSELDRDRHMLVHGDRWPFACELCGHGATRYQALELHVRKHPFVYVCSLCWRKFVSSIRLRAHIREAHAEGPAPEAALFARSIDQSFCLLEPGGDLQQEGLGPRPPPPAAGDGGGGPGPGDVRGPSSSGPGAPEAGRAPEAAGEPPAGGPAADGPTADGPTAGGPSGGGLPPGGPMAGGLPGVLPGGGLMAGGLSAGGPAADDLTADDLTVGDAAPALRSPGDSGGFPLGSAGSPPPGAQPPAPAEGQGGGAPLTPSRGPGPEPDPERAGADDGPFPSGRPPLPPAPREAEPSPGAVSEPLPPAAGAGSGAFLQILDSLHKRQMNTDLCERIRKVYGDLECEYCGKLFWYQVHLDMHVRTHTREHLFHCSQCSYSSVTKNCLKRHVIQKHSNVLLECPTQGCGYSTPDKYKLQAHLKVHTELDKRSYSCPVCSKSFSEDRLIKSHIKTNHPEVSMNTISEILGRRVQLKGLIGKRAVKCPYCDFYFMKNGSDLQRHIWAHEGVKPFKCSLCEYATRSKSNLKAHMNRHSTEKTHLCDMCGKKFKSKGTLKSHKLLHTADGKQFKCTVCDYHAAQQPQLLRHMEQHASFKPFRCAHCHYSCNISGSLKRHYNRKHPNEEYVNVGSGELAAEALIQQGGIKCPICSFVYGTKWEFNRHLKNKHSLKLVENDGGTKWELTTEISEEAATQFLHIAEAEEDAQGTQEAVEALQDLRYTAENGERLDPTAVNILQQILELGNESHDATAVASVVAMAPGTVTVVKQAENDLYAERPGLPVTPEASRGVWDTSYRVTEEEQASGHTVMIQETLQQASVGLAEQHHLLVSADEVEGIETVTVYTQGGEPSEFIVYVQEALQPADQPAADQATPDP
ncbi:zinc finger protein ZFAT isoform X2 [Ornithorhynchus anatinus]|uniref:zinc finger protein ZFAT isoform X2 n=1 Tax=Ornithorhynchus anatinus TaxID=9258 RepID=UPI0010A774F3|nr:zinc finger protein ZFAT isoform X2 [Ornithorhynchus anatinus]